MSGEPKALKNLFLGALEKDTPAERSVFLDQACAGDAELRRRLEAMLRVHDKPDRLFDQTAPEHLSLEEEPVPLDFLEPTTKAGSIGRLGHYDVLEVVGKGGMGIVLRAFDEKLHRIVAIKVL